MCPLCEAREKEGAEKKRLTVHAFAAIIAVAFVVGLCPGLAAAQPGNVVVSDRAQATAANVAAVSVDLAPSSDGTVKNLAHFASAPCSASA